MAAKALPPFIWGESVSELGFSEIDYLTHTSYPRFACEVHEQEGCDTSLHLASQKITGELGLKDGELVYFCEQIGLVFARFALFDEKPKQQDLLKACDLAVLNYLLGDDEYRSHFDASI